MFDQLVIGSMASHDDFDATVASRKIKDGAKKEIKKTVPFSNRTYDFSNMDGEIYWEEKELEYTLEIIADSVEELEEKKIALKSWVMNVFQEKLYDPYVPDYHFIATFKDIDFDDSEVEKTTATVKFSAYPYMISNTLKTYRGDFDKVSYLVETPVLVNAVCTKATWYTGNYVDYIVPMNNKSLKVGKTYRAVFPDGTTDNLVASALDNNRDGNILNNVAGNVFTFAATGSNDSKGSNLLILRRDLLSSENKENLPESYALSLYELKKPEREHLTFTKRDIPLADAQADYVNKFVVETKSPTIYEGEEYIVRFNYFEDGGIDFPCVAAKNGTCYTLEKTEGLTQFKIDFYTNRVEIAFRRKKYDRDENTITELDVDIALPLGLIKIVNYSSHKVTPTFISDVPFAVQTEKASYAFPAGSFETDNIRLERGITNIGVYPSGHVTVQFREEVF